MHHVVVLVCKDIIAWIMFSPLILEIYISNSNAFYNIVPGICSRTNHRKYTTIILIVFKKQW